VYFGAHGLGPLRVGAGLDTPVVFLVDTILDFTTTRLTGRLVVDFFRATILIIANFFLHD
jgi:hypothetical protein